jgi:anti-sigma28 factor (negative regulator of flagellin synthesis)
MTYRGGIRGERSGSEAGPLASMQGVTRFEVCGLEVEEDAETMADEEKARLAGEMRSRAQVGSDVRLELVAGIRARILAGTYRVTAEDVAEKLMGALRR